MDQQSDIYNCANHVVYTSQNKSLTTINRTILLSWSLPVGGGGGSWGERRRRGRCMEPNCILSSVWVSYMEPHCVVGLSCGGGGGGLVWSPLPVIIVFSCSILCVLNLVHSHEQIPVTLTVLVKLSTELVLSSWLRIFFSFSLLKKTAEFISSLPRYCCVSTKWC